MLNSIEMIDDGKIASLLNIADISLICAKVFEDIKNNKAFSPSKYSLTLPGNSARCMRWINSMPAYLSEEQVAGIKWVSVCSENSKHNLPTTTGVIVLNGMQTGIPYAILDASLITHYRTAASVLLAAKKFAPKNSEVATVIGPGMQGSYSMLFLQSQYKLKRINVISKTKQGYVNFKAFMSRYGEDSSQLEVQRTDDVSKSVNESDIILSSSSSMQPLLTKDNFQTIKKQNKFICGLSAFNDISLTILDVIDNLVFDDVKSAEKRIEENFKIKISELNFCNIFSMTSIEACKSNFYPGINLYLPVGIAAMDIAIANYFYKKHHHRA